MKAAEEDHYVLSDKGVCRAAPGDDRGSPNKYVLSIHFYQALLLIEHNVKFVEKNKK